MNLEAFSLKGKTALVTGSSRGLGSGIAIALAEAGAQVALHGTETVRESTQQQVAQTGARFAAFTGDISDEPTCVRLVDQVLAHFGQIDILVNNAGTTRRTPAVEYSLEDWNLVLATNLTSVFRLTQLAGKGMLERGHGKIINIASLLTFSGGILVPAYAAAKGGVGQLTKAFANEWASKGVCVNAIAPGYMATELNTDLRNDEVRNRQITERIPAGRWGTPADLGGAAVFLASAASDYIHGQVLAVDGGWMAR